MSEAPKRLWAMCTACENWDEPIATPFKVDHFEPYVHADQITALQAENARLREALEPFSIFAGVLFAQNFHRDDAVATIKGAHGQATLIFEAFLDARAAVKKET